MQITLEALEKALVPIEELGQAESTFEVNGLSLTMRILTPEQEVEVARQTNDSLRKITDKENKEEEGNNGQEFIENFRLAVLSHAIVAIGEHDLREIKFVDTGEKLPNGKEVKIPTQLAIKQLILKQRWTGAIRNGLMRKYSELISRVEKHAEKAIEFEPSDMDAEITRLEQRIKTLKESKEEKSGSPVSNVSKAIASDDAVQQEALRDAISKRGVRKAEPATESTVKPEPEVAAQAPQTRQPVTPVAAPPLDQQQPVEAAPRPAVQRPMPPPETESFVDPEDSESMEAAVARETMRLMAARNGRPLPEAPSIIPPRRPPHAAAREVAREVFQDGNVQPPAGVKSAMQLPVETITRQQPPKTPIPVNANTVNQGTQNPRFRRAQGG